MQHFLSFISLHRCCCLQVIGYAKVDLDGVRDNVRSRETNLGDLVADSMLLAIKSLPGFEAKFGETFIAIQNGGCAGNICCLQHQRQQPIAELRPRTSVVGAAIMLHCTGPSLLSGVTSCIPIVWLDACMAKCLHESIHADRARWWSSGSYPCWQRYAGSCHCRPTIWQCGVSGASRWLSPCGSRSEWRVRIPRAGPVPTSKLERHSCISIVHIKVCECALAPSGHRHSEAADPVCAVA